MIAHRAFGTAAAVTQPEVDGKNSANNNSLLSTIIHGCVGGGELDLEKKKKKRAKYKLMGEIKM